MQNLIIWSSLIGAVFGIVTSLLAIGSLYRGSVRKGYAAERDFEHLKNDYKALSRSIDFLAKNFERDFLEIGREIDERCDRIVENQIEIKALLLSNLGLKPKDTNG